MKTQTTFKISEKLTRSLDEVDRTLASGNLDLQLDFSACTFISVEGLEWLEELLQGNETLTAQLG